MSAVSICYDENALHVTFHNQNQTIYSAKAFQDCNDAVYNLDVVEMFISPLELFDPNTIDPYCYTEVDLSPYDKIYQSGIYNKNLNHSGVMNYLLNCSSSGITHWTAAENTTSSTWNGALSIPWNIINHPNGCPIALENAAVTFESYLTTFSPVLRANFYRVRELAQIAETGKCSSSTCEYLAWSPTLSNPPAFHEPTKFGYILLR